ncbi:MAG: hypothetical protein ABJ360_02690 [Roseobacter sp.]
MENKRSGGLPEGKEFIRFLNAVEGEIKPDTCAIAAFNYWPIIRFALNGKRAGKSLKGEGALPQVTALQLKKLRAMNFLGLEHRATPSYPKSYFSHLEKADVLFLNRNTQYNNNLPGYSIQFFTDGLRHLASNGISCATMVNRDPRQAGEQFWVDTVILPKPKSGRGSKLLNPSGFPELAVRDRVVAKISEVNKVIKQLGIDHHVNERYILQRIDRTVELVHYFELLFRQVQPKVVYLSSFTGAYHVCVAAKRLGIKVVDIQHGGMHKNHPLAANWTHVPETGYELLPDVFWCWTERTAEYISSTFTDCHKAIVGGNTKAAFEKAVFEQSASKITKSVEKPSVLVALQYGQSALVAPHVEAAYKATKEEANWRFRLHPRGIDRLEEAAKLLSISKEDILLASERPLHEIFPNTSCLLTNASTIVYEALDHGVRPAVWSDKGRAFFDDLLDTGDLGFVATVNDVVDFIMSNADSQPPKRKCASDEEDHFEVETIKAHFQSLFRG